MELILASSSPYRQSMLARLALPFTCVSPQVDETPRTGETVVELALRLSQEKALKIAKQHAGALVIGADQVATFDGNAIGKPGNFERAQAQLLALSGKTVEFHSALCLTDGTRVLSSNVITRCRFRELERDEIDFYLHHEQPFDTAGSAKAEGLGITLMQAIESDDPTAIIGLPLIELTNMLRQFGVNPLRPPTHNKAGVLL